MVEMVEKGKATMDGNPEVLKQLASTMTVFDPWFEILPGTGQDVKGKVPKDEVFKDDAPVGSAARYGD